MELNNTRVGDAGVVHLAGLANLMYVHLSGTRITDDALIQLSKLPGLYQLDVDHTAISDRGIACLSGVKNLNFLNVAKSPGVTDAGIAGLRKTQPGLDVTR